jgi:AraC family transcriptional regulator
MTSATDSLPCTHGGVVAAHSFGRVLRGCSLRRLSVEEVLMPSGLVLDEHGHEDAQICFLLEGEYWESAAGRSWLLRPGSTWFRPPRALHANRVPPEGDALALLVTVERERFASLERILTRPRLLRSALLAELRTELQRELEVADHASALALEGWSLLLLSQTGRLLSDGCDERRPAWLDEALHILETSYCEPLSLATLAAQVGVHPATLAAGCRRFRRASVGGLIRERRLRHAREALGASRTPIKQIAVESGFYDQAHLSRCFKRRYGVPPAAFRRGGEGARRDTSESRR